MNKSNTFQIILLGLFGFFIIVGMASFILFRGSGSENVSVVIWGTMPSSTFTEVASVITDADDRIKISYAEKSPETFDSEFIEALAVGRAPDIILLSDSNIYRHSDKILSIPYDSLSERDFRSTFLEEGEMFLRGSGISAIPWSIDPLVMYWNRSLFSNAAVASPPLFWDEFVTLSSKLTKKDQASNIRESAVALGEYRNISNAKEILSALFFQANNPIVRMGEQGLESTLDSNAASGALNFYTEFANPVKPMYSWNRSLANSKNRFASGDLAMYFGFASELSEIRARNPNLNFDVAPLPQLRSSRTYKTFGRLQAFAISRTAQNPTGAMEVIFKLTSQGPLKRLSELTFLPPVRRDMLASKPVGNSAVSVFYDSALISKAWLDPGRTRTSEIFQTMVESVTSGRQTPSDAIRRASGDMNSVLGVVSQ